MEQSAKFEEVKIQIPEAAHGVDAVTAVVGIPEWWPTGTRVAVVMAHDSTGDLNDPLIAYLHQQLTLRKFLTLRFNFPFAEAGRRASENTSDLLEKTYRAAISILGRDPSAAPAHVFLGGKGIGGRVAAKLASSRLQIEGLFFLGYPLHPADQPEQAQGDQLYRIISPMLFVQGSRDRRCDLGALRRCIARVGAPTTLQIIEGADHALRAPIPPEGDPEDREPHRIIESVAAWIETILKGK